MPQKTSDTKDVRHNARLTFIMLFIALCAFIVAHICGQQTKLVAPKSMGTEEYSVLPNTLALQWMSLGYKEFVADLIWIRALQYNNLKNEAHLAEMFADAIISLDPKFEPAYKYAALNAVFSENISLNGVTKAMHYLELGAERFPATAYYPYTLAMNYISYYPQDGPMSESERRQKAIYYLQQAVQKRDAPADISMLISGLLNKDGASAKIKFLQQAILTENDPQNKKHLQTRLILMTQDAGDESTLLNAKRDLWRDKHHNYLPSMLDYLVSYK